MSHESNTYLNELNGLRQKCNEQTNTITNLHHQMTAKDRELDMIRREAKELLNLFWETEMFTRRVLLDPAVNLELELMKKQVEIIAQKEKEAQDALQASEFHPDSVTGRRLLAKCKTLQQENEELGKQISQDKVTILEQEKEVQTKQLNDLKKSLEEKSEIIENLENERDQLYAVIYHLQNKVKSQNITTIKTTTFFPIENEEKDDRRDDTNEKYQSKSKKRKYDQNQENINENDDKSKYSSRSRNENGSYYSTNYKNRDSQFDQLSDKSR